MKEFRGTKGEWLIEMDDFEGYSVYLKDEDNVGTAYIAREICQGYDEGLDDAKLIASAPDLLEALQGILTQIENEHCSEFMDEFVDKAEKAIEKALG